MVAEGSATNNDISWPCHEQVQGGVPPKIKLKINNLKSTRNFAGKGAKCIRKEKG